MALGEGLGKHIWQPGVGGRLRRGRKYFSICISRLKKKEKASHLYWCLSLLCQGVFFAGDDKQAVCAVLEVCAERLLWRCSFSSGSCISMGPSLGCGGRILKKICQFLNPVAVRAHSMQFYCLLMDLPFALWFSVLTVYPCINVRV